jgi:hypothetical protein
MKGLVRKGSGLEWSRLVWAVARVWCGIPFVQKYLVRRGLTRKDSVVEGFHRRINAERSVAVHFGVVWHV